ncbi:MAG: hypothetical protein H0X50_00560 [Nitrosopumilus sp.]|nr:hypothetical protein [Nitrosopumilus sp.]
MKISEINIQILLVMWCIGAVVAGVALLIPIYSLFFIVGSIGWLSVVIITLLFFMVLKNK